jgi:putative FmdB family regulatory protein
MPIYEYLCEECQKISSYLVLNIHQPFRPKCKRCSSSKLTRVISRIARIRSEEKRLESLSDPSHLQDIDEKDPSSMARWMKRMGKELGEETEEDFDGMIDEAMEERKKGNGTSGEDEEEAL